MNTDCSGFHCGCIWYLRLCTYILVYYIYIYIYIYIRYIVCKHKRKNRLCQSNKNSSLILHTTLYNNEQNIFRVVCTRFRKRVVSSHVVQQRQHLDEAESRTFFISGLISKFVFDIFQISGACIWICSMRIVTSYNSLATALTPTQMYTNPHL
jgi:hypothetical protein